MTRAAIGGLYVIADTGLDLPGGLVPALELALRGGARVVQYRNKQAPDTAGTDTARTLRALCRREGIPFIVNDDIELALALDADGVHLGRADAGVSQARGRLGPDLLIGASCYNDLRMALAARDAGADYVAFGSFYASPTKPDAVRATPALLREARRALDLPLVAIGGITPDNGKPLIAAGADALAVISGVLGQHDPEAAAKHYARLWNRRTR